MELSNEAITWISQFTGVDEDTIHQHAKAANHQDDGNKRAPAAKVAGSADPATTYAPGDGAQGSKASGGNGGTPAPCDGGDPSSKKGGAAKPPGTRQPTLRSGDKGSDGWVEYLQELLNDLENAGLKVDGVFGGGTLKAVKAYQAKNKLMVDGIVGNQTWASLRGTAPETPSTDGRTPHSFHETGKEARWYVADGNCLYLESKDELLCSVVSTGDQPADDGKATITVSAPAGGEQSFVRPLGKPARKTPTGEGNIHEITISKFHKTMGVDTPIEAFVVEGVLDSELGGDTFKSHITMTLGKVEPVPPGPKPGPGPGPKPGPGPGPKPGPGPGPKPAAGTKPVDVQVMATDWQGEPMRGFEGIVEFKSSGVPDATGGGEIKGGVVSVSGLLLAEKGTLRFMCISRGKAQIVPEGLTAFTRPAKGGMIFTATQQFRTGKVSATSGQEAAQKVGASGKLGADFKVFTAEGEITTEEELKKTKSITVEYEVRFARPAFDLKQN